MVWNPNYVCTNLIKVPVNSILLQQPKQVKTTGMENQEYSELIFLYRLLVKHVCTSITSYNLLKWQQMNVKITRRTEWKCWARVFIRTLQIIQNNFDQREKRKLERGGIKTRTACVSQVWASMKWISQFAEEKFFEAKMAKTLERRAKFESPMGKDSENEEQLE